MTNFDMGLREILPLYMQKDIIPKIKALIMKEMLKGNFIVNGQDEFEKGRLFGFQQALKDMKEVLG